MHGTPSALIAIVPGTLEAFKRFGDAGQRRGEKSQQKHSRNRGRLVAKPLSSTAGVVVRRMDDAP